jgi:transposase
MKGPVVWWRSRLLSSRVREALMAARREPWRVSDRFWLEVEPLLPRVERRFRYPGRKRHDDRACLEGIVFVLRFAIPWAELPAVAGWPSGQTCWRRFREWQRAGVWERLLQRMHELLIEEGLVDWSRAIVDASLVEAKRGAARSRARSGGGLGAVST